MSAEVARRHGESDQDRPDLIDGDQRRVVASSRTRLPSRTRRLPVRPEIGARMVAYCRLSRAWSTAAWLAATVAVAAAASLRAASFCSAVTYSFSARVE